MLVADLAWIIVLMGFGVCTTFGLVHIVVVGSTVQNCIGVVWLSCVLILLGCVDSSIHPYDMIECEPELVCGYFVDHGGVLFMLVYLADGCGIVVIILYCCV